MRSVNSLVGGSRAGSRAGWSRAAEHQLWSPLSHPHRDEEPPDGPQAPGAAHYLWASTRGPPEKVRVGLTLTLAIIAVCSLYVCGTFNVMGRHVCIACSVVHTSSPHHKCPLQQLGHIGCSFAACCNGFCSWTRWRTACSCIPNLRCTAVLSTVLGGSIACSGATCLNSWAQPCCRPFAGRWPLMSQSAETPAIWCAS